jgi:hypothetical protein
MTSNPHESMSNKPGLTPFDRVCIDRLLKSGDRDIAIKLYRSACRCSMETAEQEIDAILRSPPVQ